ncbi:hypothetical protein AB1L88_15720 [Tautonia sp. JC769]|uniref:hypothetical protein n=1 Tax=Tautonia sp. JC769 TaxID=3232135 RepID=UPI00345A8FBE
MTPEHEARDLTPEARLKPGLAPEDGIPVELEGGHTWFLARARPGLRPRFGPDGEVSLATVDGRFGPKYSEQLERLGRARTDTEVFSVLFPMAALLLRERYELSDADLERLLVVYPDDEADGTERLRALMAAVNGRSIRPKASDATSEPAPWPTE